MFQTTYERPRKSVRVQLVLAGKAPVDGDLIILKDDTMIRALNGEEQFLIFETAGRERQYIAKSAIQSITEIEVLSTDETSARAGDGRLAERFASSDPHVLLGIPPDASHEVVREAYHLLARDFHSDRLASLGLHRELIAYADEVLKRINMAYNSLERGARVAA
jgi:DnaJ-domain-containing protein 1